MPFNIVEWSDTLNYNCILVWKEPPWRWSDYWPKHVDEHVKQQYIHKINVRFLVFD